MLLELYDRNHKKLANLTGIKSPHIQRTLEYGDETLDFSYPTSGPWLAQLLAECYIRTDRQEYVVKAVEKSSTSAWRKVSCALNIEELEGAPFEGFETVEQTVQAAAEFALEGTGWTVETDADITKKRTIRKEDDTTVWEVVKQIVTTYRLELEIDAVNKRLKFHTRRGRDRGAYFIERLNLRSLGVKTSSYGFYTRLIPIGKDGLHLWRDGQNYIENHQYSDKVITSIWRDERYTVTAALLEDAQARLDEASTPARAYTAELVDLAAQSDKYNALAYDLGDDVLLVSEKTDEREKQRIVKLDEYDKWEAAYTASDTSAVQNGLWQYSSKNALKIAGFGDKLDCDVSYKDYPAIMRQAGLNGYAKQAATDTTQTHTTPAANRYQFSLGPVSSGDKKPIETALLPVVQRLALESLYSCQAVE